jgi:hypothetical protein
MKKQNKYNVTSNHIDSLYNNFAFVIFVEIVLFVIFLGIIIIGIRW